MRLGSMFAGLGGLDLAAEHASPGASTAWQLDMVGADIRRRHWPDAVQVEGDVRDVDPLDLPRIDGLLAGFSCRDLSVAGTQAGLDDGKNTGPTYQALLRFTAALSPDLVVMENVPALLSYKARLEREWGAMGYGLTWVKARALDAGAPHIRRRVFVLAQKGRPHVHDVLEAPRDGVWTPDVDERNWPTTTTSDANGSGAEAYSTDSGRHAGVTLTDAVRPWATLTASEAKGRRVSIGRREDPDMLSEQVRPWATATATNPNEGEAAADWHARQARVREETGHNTGFSEPLAQMVRTWPTLTATDCKTPAGFVRTSGHPPARIGEALQAGVGKRLNPDWVETLVGLPVGWTRPEGPSLRHLLAQHRWPRGRYPESWDRSKLWPGYEWEPPRTLPDGEPVRGRPARIRACGNCVVWQQGELAIRTALAGPVQRSLFGGAA